MGVKSTLIQKMKERANGNNEKSIKGQKKNPRIIRYYNNKRNRTSPHITL